MLATAHLYYNSILYSHLYYTLTLYALFVKLEFVRLIDKYGLRGAELEQKSCEKICASLPRTEQLPAADVPCAVYLAEDGSLGIAWADGVCMLTPMEVQMELKHFWPV